MSEIWQLADSWPLRVAFAGGAILLVGRMLICATRQPARRSAIGLVAVAIALFVIPLSLLPGWLPISPPSSVKIASTDVQNANVNGRRMPDNSIAPETSALSSSATAESTNSAAIPAPNESPFPLAQRAADESASRSRPAPRESATSQTIAAPAESTPASSLSVPAIIRLALLIYGVIAFGLLVRLVLGHLGLSRIWRTAAPAPESVDRIFRDLARDTCPQARLRISSWATGPVCFGIVRPRVLAPITLVATADDAALRCIFAHELGHLGRRDPLAGWLLGVARAIYFVWPWLAGLRREIRLAQEYLADTAAARHATLPADYAELLIRMTRARPAPLGAAGARGSGSELYRRVTMLLKNHGQVETRCPRRWKLAIAGGLTALAVAAVGIYVAPRPARAADPEKKQAPKATPAAKTDSIKDLIEKLKKDVGDDPEKKKQLEELQKQVKPKAVEPTPPAPRTAPPVAFPNFLDPNLPEDQLFKELLKGQDDVFKQLEQMLGQVQAGQGMAFGIGPDGVVRPLRASGVAGLGGGRLGIRVERPSDVVASQLDLPNGQGLVCVDVPAESNAGKIGLKPHDILLEVAGKPVSSDVSQFVAALKEIKPDKAVDIVVMRKGRKETLKNVKLPEAKEVAATPGLQLFPRAIAIPAPQFPALPKGTVPQDGIGVVAGPGETVRVEKVNDAFTVFYSKNGVKVTISGSKEAGGPAKAESIEVDDNGKTTKADSIDKLPKQYQDAAKSAMKAIK